MGVELGNAGNDPQVQDGGWAQAGEIWAALAPLPPANVVAAGALSAMPRWQVAIRRCDGVAVGSRLLWNDRQLAVRSLNADPRDPARIELICEELR